MQKLNHLKSLAVVLLLVCSGTQASTKLEPVGLAIYTETARDIYVGALLLPPGGSVGNIYLAPGPKAMEYRIALRRISSRGFSGTLLLQAELGSGSRAPEHVIAAISKLKKNFKSALKQGDRFVITLSVTGATRFALNGVELLSVDDDSVFDYFLKGWIGESSSALLRNALLSGTLDTGTLTRFESLAPTAERLAIVSNWMGSAAAPVSAPRKAVPVQVAMAPAAKTVPLSAAERVATPVKFVTPAKTPVAKTTQVADDREYQRQLSEYVTQIMKKIFRKVAYPKRAIQRDREGKVELLVSVDKNGNLLDISLGSSSGYDVLDSAARKAVRKAAPFPELSLVAREEFLAEDGTSYIMPIPITFKLSN